MLGNTVSHRLVMGETELHEQTMMYTLLPQNLKYIHV